MKKFPGIPILIILFALLPAGAPCEPLQISRIDSRDISQGQIMEIMNSLDGLKWSSEEGHFTLEIRSDSNESRSLILRLYKEKQLEFERKITYYAEDLQNQILQILLRELEIYPLIQMAEAEEIPLELPEIDEDETTLLLLRGDKLLKAGEIENALAVYTLEKKNIPKPIQKLIDQRVDYCRRMLSVSSLVSSYNRADMATCRNEVQKSRLYTNDQKEILINSLSIIEELRSDIQEKSVIFKTEYLLETRQTDKLIAHLKILLHNLETADIEKKKHYIHALYQAHFFADISDLPIFLPMISVPAGNYRMGINETEIEQGKNDDASPLHNVKLDAFAISPLEVTAGEFCILMNWAVKKDLIQVTEDGILSPMGEMLYPLFYYESLQLMWDGEEFSLTFPERALYPVHSITWEGARYYTRLLSQREQRNFTLPTEAQWEYAAAGGKKNRETLFSGSNDSAETAWTSLNSWGEAEETGRLQPNELGIHDMSGNVSEWCLDWYNFNYYSVSPRNNPSGPDSSQWGRVVRGGSAFWHKEKSRITSRGYSHPEEANSELGFRIIEELP